MKNDFKSAQTQLTKALKGAKSRQELAETYKFLGVAQYMSGNKQAATQSFQKAKSINPTVKLSDTEVVDESVIPFFNAANASVAKNMPRATGASSSAVARQKSKRTLLKVMSNAPGASVSLDGIAYGTAGQDIEVQPGKVVLEVSASGYKKKAIRVQLEPLTASSVTVNLEKIMPKPKPQPNPQIATQTSPGSIPLPDAAVPVAPSAKKPSGKSGGAKSNDLFDDEPTSDSFAVTAPVPQGGQPGMQQPMQPQMVVPPAAPGQPVMPQQGYGAPQNPYAVQPMYQQPPVYQQPMYPPPAYPGYAPPYQAAPYGGYMAPQNPYAYPPPPPSVYQPYAPAPVADPYGGYLGPPPEAPATLPPPIVESTPKDSGGGMPPPPRLPPPLPTSEDRKKAREKNESGCGAIIKILPFGAGQFCNGSTLKGVFFIGSELVSLYFYKSNTDAAATYKKKVDEIMIDRENARVDVDPSEQDAYDAETDYKWKQGQTAITKAKTNAQYSLISFGGLWAAGVLDAFINEPSSTKKTSKKSSKSKKRKPRIIQSYHLDLERAPMGTLALSIPYETRGFDDMEFLFGYAPTTDPHDRALKHSLALGITWEL